ncbi:MAG TPA: histidine kinase, partial [Luteitalea sp.]|nr:histidine kinase [Luteitalea sp.]
PLSRRLRNAALLAAFWTGLGLLFALPGLNRDGQFREQLPDALTQWWAWGLVSLAIVAVDRRLPFNDRQLALRVLAHVPLGVVFTMAYMYVAAAIRATLGLGPWGAVWSRELVVMALKGMALWSLIIYWVIVGVWTAYRYHQRFLSSELQRERIERLSGEARLQVLRLQLDPHFLFNALNTISAQLEADPRLARRMLEHLGDLLRLTLDSGQRTFLTLDEELDFLDHYLAIQRIRFGERLRVHQAIDDRVRYALVPSLSLQPLVENAIRHGLSARAAGGTVTVTAGIGAHGLEVVVEDDGDGLPAGFSLATSRGRGLSITRERLAGLYQDEPHHFDVVPRAGGGTVVIMRVPLRMAAGTPVREALRA